MCQRCSRSCRLPGGPGRVSRYSRLGMSRRVSLLLQALHMPLLDMAEASLATLIDLCLWNIWLERVLHVERAATCLDVPWRSRGNVIPAYAGIQIPGTSWIPAPVSRTGQAARE
jgi:hypothetical protein